MRRLLIVAAAVGLIAAIVWGASPPSELALDDNCQVKGVHKVRALLRWQPFWERQLIAVARERERLAALPQTFAQQDAILKQFDAQTSELLKDVQAQMRSVRQLDNDAFDDWTMLNAYQERADYLRRLAGEIESEGLRRLALARATREIARLDDCTIRIRTHYLRM